MPPKGSKKVKTGKPGSEPIGGSHAAKAPSSEITPTFKRGETVVAMDQGLPYDAMVLKVQKYADDRMWLFLHFKGWSRRYDCWHMAESVAKKGDKQTVEKLKEKYSGENAVEPELPASPAGAAGHFDTGSPEKDDVKEETEATLATTENGRGRGRPKKVIRAKRKGARSGAVDDEESDGYTMDIEIGDGVNDETASGITDLSPRSSRSAQLEKEVKEEKVESDAAYRKRQRQEATQRVREIAKNQRLLAESDMMEDPDEECATLTNLGIPPPLKKHLVDEWSFITEEPRCLVSLPREFTVNKIIKEYLQSKKGKVSDEIYTEHEEVFDGLKMWFDKALPMILLYRCEREQFDKVKALMTADSDNSGMEASTVYGVEHLMRAMVQMGKMTSGVVAKQVEIDALYSKLGDFMKFVNKNFNKYNKKEDYIPAEEALETDLTKVIVPPGRTTRGR